MGADDLVGIYAGGSYALGAYESGRSDLDVAAVVRSTPPLRLKEQLVGALRDERLPCPARGLEFVLYRLEAVNAASSAADFELNLNTGADMPFKAEYQPGPEEQHWYPIDRSILRQSGVALHGPPPQDVFAPLPRAVLLRLVRDSVAWHATGDARDDDVVLNACRAWRFAHDGAWSSKPEAGAWALEQGAPPLVAAALAARGDDGRLDERQVGDFVAAVATELDRAVAHGSV